METTTSSRRPLGWRTRTLVYLGLMLVCGLTLLARPAPSAAVDAAAPPAAADTPTLREDVWVTNGPVSAIAQSGNTIYLGGAFTWVGPPTGSFALLDQTTGAPNANLPLVNGPVNATISDGAGGWYIGGAFTKVGSTDRRYLAHILANNTLDLNWNPDADGEVRALALSGAMLYVGGSFRTIGANAEQRSLLAALDAATGNATGWNPQPVGIEVEALAVSGTTLYVGGDFSTIGVNAQARNRLAALDTTTGNATPWNPNPDYEVNTLVVSGNTVYAGGDFSTIGANAQARNRLAVSSTASGNATDWNPNLNGLVTTLALSGANVYVSGYFTTVGSQYRPYLALFYGPRKIYLPLVRR